ncbi:MAG: DeoR/GlpR family DNA-binding transcription regulator [Microbacterium sp.]
MPESIPATARTPEQRWEFILQELAAHGRVEGSGLAAQLGVAEETIRRDFRRLEAEGRLRRAHGGALSLAFEVQLVEDLGKPGSVPGPLSRAAAQFLPAQGWIYLDGGAAIEGLATLIPESSNLTAVAGSVAAALNASGGSGVSVVAVGGASAPGTGILTGAWTMQSIRRYFFDVCFIEMQGISPAGDLLAASTELAAGREAVLGRSRLKVAVWDGANALSARVRFGHLDEVDALICPADADLGPGDRNGLRIVRAEEVVP